MRGRGGQRGRGFSRGGQDNREWDSKRSATQNGPLMTDHLRDIDLELEILNRRRQMLQQEHELIDRERDYNFKRQYDYEQPMTSYNKPNYYHQQGNKRQAVERASAKPFNPPARVEPWKHNAQSNDSGFFAQVSPLLGSVLNKFLTRPVPPSRKEFRPTKPTAPVVSTFNPTRITKQKSRTGYLKKTSIPNPKDIQPKTKSITPKPAYVPPKSSEASTSAPIEDDIYILRHNVQPSPQLNGRLELALGYILKDVKKIDPSNYSQIASSFQSQRTLKQIIRERIHSVVLDKKVGHMQDIVASYRTKYPVESDAELLKLGHDYQVYSIHTLGITPTINSDNIKEFFKANLTNVLHKKVEKMFGQLKDTGSVQDGDESILKIMDDVVNIHDSGVIAEDSNQSPETKTGDLSKDKESEEEKVNRKINKAKIYMEFMEKLIDVKLPSILTKHKQSFVSMIEIDKEYKLAKAEVIEATVKEAISLAAKKIDNKTSIISENTTMPKETELVKENESVSVLEPTLTQNISNPSVACVNTPTSKITDHPYYVKVVGRPELPSRASVYEYLEQFKPASIKKHKTIGNLLVIGFNEKLGYDKILEAGEKIIGENTITVKSSEKVNITPQKQNPQKVENGDATPQKNALQDTTSKESNNSLEDGDENSLKKSTSDEENKNQDSSFDNLNIGQDLEDEITNLLTVVNDEDETEDKGNEKEENTQPGEASKINSEVTQTTACKENTQPMESISEDIENGTDTKYNANEINQEKQTTNNERIELKDDKSNLKDSGRATPTRSSSRLASTPSTIKTRRASRLAQNQ